MTVGLPGTGIGGLLYCCLTLFLPFRGRRRASWPLCAMVAAIILLLWAEAWTLDALLATAATTRDAAGGPAEARDMFVRVGQFAAVGSLATLCALLAAAAVAARVVHGIPFFRSRLMRRTALLLPLFVLTGCTALVVGALAAGAAYGTVKYLENEAVRDYKAGSEAVWIAAREQLQSMGYMVSDEIEAGPRGGEIDVDDAWVKVERLDETYTRVSVRFGTFDTDTHREKARRFLEGIAERL